MPITNNHSVELPEQLNLEELLAQITPENKHEEVSWGTPVGSEIW